jgi:uncharacterized C2H2 Zn-finger protein
VYLTRSFKCPYCEQVFPSKELCKAHIKQRHSDKVQEFLKQISEYKLKKLMGQGVDPEEWASGWLCTWF